MVNEDVIPVLKWFSDHGLAEELGYTVKHETVIFWVNISDVFNWGGADIEYLSVSDLPELTRAYDELSACGDFLEVYAPELWAARATHRTPQGPWLVKLRANERAMDLFEKAAS